MGQRKRFCCRSDTLGDARHFLQHAFNATAMIQYVFGVSNEATLLTPHKSAGFARQVGPVVARQEAVITDSTLHNRCSLKRLQASKVSRSASSVSSATQAVPADTSRTQRKATRRRIRTRNSWVDANGGQQVSWQFFPLIQECYATMQQLAVAMKAKIIIQSPPLPASSLTPRGICSLACDHAD